MKLEVSTGGIGKMLSATSIHYIVELYKNYSNAN